MNPNTEEARRLASKLRSVIPPKNHEASRILDSAAFTLRLLAADVNKLEAENEALRADKVRLDWLGLDAKNIPLAARAFALGWDDDSFGIRQAIDAAVKEKP